MIEILLTLLGGVGVTYFLMNKKLSECSSKISKAESEAITAKGYQQHAQEQVVKIQKRHSEFVTSVKQQMQQKVAELESKYKKQADDRVQKVINDYEEALKLETEGLEKQVSELDEQLGIKLQEITGKNTMYFTCTCDRSKQIPCSVDLSSEDNYFTCPECGAVYRIVINASTILQSGITNNPKIANMFDGVEIGEKQRTMI